MNDNLTVVTGIWDLKRHEAGEGFKRAFSHYIEHFKKLLKTDYNLFIYIEKEYEHIIWESGRSRENTFVIIKSSSEFKDSFPFYNQVKKIREDESWLNQTSWLRESTQATLDLYNPMVMSKMFSNKLPSATDAYIIFFN